MRQLGALILFVGLASPAWSADPPVEQSSVPWYRWVFLGERSKPVPAKSAASAKPVSGTSAPSPDPKAQVARTLELEQEVYLKRLQAISRIRQIAVDRGDDEMVRNADALERDAEDVYNQRTAHLLSKTGDDRSALERGRDDGAKTADAARRRNTRGNDK